MTKARLRHIADHAAKTKDDAAGAMLTECVAAIRHLQSFTRRGELPDEPEPQDLPKKAKGKNGTADPRIAEFTTGWEHAYQSFNNEKYPHGGAKDVQAIKRLLNIGAVSDLLDTAWDAWQHPDKFNCAAAITIAGFASRYANIKLELRTLANGGRPSRTEPAGVTL